MDALIGFTSPNAAAFAEISSRFPMAEFHYDGILTENNASELQQYTAGHRTTVWVPYPNDNTNWLDAAVHRASAQWCAYIHSLGFEVGVWLLTLKTELAEARNVFHADIIETNGMLKPL